MITWLPFDTIFGVLLPKFDRVFFQSPNSLMEVLDFVPPPIYSDGSDECVKNALKNGLQLSRTYIGPYFRQIVQPLKDMFTQYPQEMNQPRAPGSFQFSPNAVLNELPRNYELFSDTQNRTLVVAGHPRYID